MNYVEWPSQAVLSHCKGDSSEPVVEQAIGHALRLAVRKWDGRIALVDGSLCDKSRRTWTFEQLLASAERVARALLSRFTPGERVAIWSPNCPGWVLLEFGAALAGITLVTANPAYLAKELARVLAQSKASGIVICPEYRGRDFRSVLGEIGHVDA